MSFDARTVLEHVPGVVAVVDGLGEILWIGHHVEAITGFRPDELVGTNILDHIDVEWNPRTLASIGYALDNPGVRLPTVLAFRAKSGEQLVLEVTANSQLQHPDLGGLVVHLRTCREDQLLDQILESFAAGEDLRSTLRRVHAVGAADTLRAETAVVITSGPPHRRGQVEASTPEIAALTDPDDLGAPWTSAARSREPVLLADLDGLPGPLRTAARALGLAACWCFPVLRPGGDGVSGVLVFWRRVPGPPEPSAEMLGERLVRLTGLVQERSEHARQLVHAARHDPLTGLANRAELFEELDRHLGAAREPVGLLYLDLDGFKPVNGQHGHGTGDRVLVSVAERLRAAVRPGDLAARVGGDELAVCCPGATVDDLVVLAERVIALVAEPITVDGTVVGVSASVGLASVPAGSCTGDVLVDAADRALLEAKASGKATWRAAVVPGAVPGAATDPAGV